MVGDKDKVIKTKIGGLENRQTFINEDIVLMVCKILRLEERWNWGCKKKRSNRYSKFHGVHTRQF